MDWIRNGLKEQGDDEMTPRHLVDTGAPFTPSNRSVHRRTSSPFWRTNLHISDSFPPMFLKWTSRRSLPARWIRIYGNLPFLSSPRRIPSSPPSVHLRGIIDGPDIHVVIQTEVAQAPRRRLARNSRFMALSLRRHPVLTLPGICSSKFPRDACL